MAVPTFYIDYSNAQWLESPTDFYDTICKLVENSSHSLTISTLYIGNGELEMKLLNIIKNKLTSNKDYKVDFFMDYGRANRFFRDSNQSCIGLIADYFGDFTDRVNIHTPSIYKKVPENISDKNAQRRFFYNEIHHVHHMKTLIVDGKKVLITGANLSDEYFTNRMDSYLLIENEYFCSFLNKFYSVYNEMDVEKISDYLYSFPEQKVENDCFMLQVAVNLPLMKFSTDDVLLSKIYSNQNDITELFVSTAYLNFVSNNFMFKLNEMKKVDSDFRVVTSHPECNSFFKEKNYKRFVPIMYSALLLNSVRAYKNFDFYEFYREKCTFHSKFIFSSTKNNNFFLYFGSSNLNHRSFYRDNEMNFLISSKKISQKAQNFYDSAKTHLFSKHERYFKKADEKTLQVRLNENKMFSFIAKVMSKTRHFRSFF